MGRRLTDEEKAMIPLMRADNVSCREIGEYFRVSGLTAWRYCLSPKDSSRTNGEVYDEVHAREKVHSTERKKPTKLTKEQIASIPEMKAGGATYKEIAELFEATLSAVRVHGISSEDPDKTNLELWLKTHKESNRELYRSNYVGSIREGKHKCFRALNKRPRPEDGACELCRKPTRKLNYHHWDDEDFSKGMYLCNICHMFAEAVDKGVSEGEYFSLKDRIDRESVEATSHLILV